MLPNVLNECAEYGIESDYSLILMLIIHCLTILKLLNIVYLAITVENASFIFWFTVSLNLKEYNEKYFSI